MNKTKTQERNEEIKLIENRIYSTVEYNETENKEDFIRGVNIAIHVMYSAILDPKIYKLMKLVEFQHNNSNSHKEKLHIISNIIVEYANE